MRITSRNRGAPARGTGNAEARKVVRDILNGAQKNDMQIIDAVSRGLPALVLDDLVHAGLDFSEIARVVGLPEGTLRRKRARGASGSLGVAESDRTIRLARIVAEADRHIGDHEKALRWLRLLSVFQN